MTDKNGMPAKESFAFGYRVCACCGEETTGRPVSRFLWPPVFADYQETEILIPGGRQHFHKDCYQRLQESEAEAAQEKARIYRLVEECDRRNA